MAPGLITSGAQEKPNIVFILADDLGYTDLGCYGNPFNETPHIDSLARSGMKFTQAYSSSPVCSPSRAGILTGIHPARLHLTNFLVGERTDPASPVLPAPWTKYLSSRETTLAEIFRTKQYECGMVGKWHLGASDSLLPSAQGFTYERMIAKNGLDYYNYSITSRNKTVFEDKGGSYLTDKLTEFGVEFIRQNSGKPFFLYLAYSAPHVLLVPRGDKLRKYLFKYEKFNGKYNPNYAAMLESMDDGVGRILQTLRELKLSDNTIVIFTSDNGGVGLPELGPIPTNLAPLRAWKGHAYEGGIRVPMIVSWPGKIRNEQVNDHYVVNTDYFPTFTELLEVKNVSRYHDGKSMLATWFNPSKDFNRGSIYWHYPHFSNQLGRPAGAIRNGVFKLVESYETGKIELFNLAEDAGEKNDLSSTHPETVRSLLADFRSWQKDVAANMPLPNPAYKNK
ncbi:MAG TPA: sulfatase [Chryseosolibacter sp.]|nr:sulfatase [Chryseosolibacter sp.]